MIALLALRNIVRNKKNSLVVALLIAVITFLFFLGNTIIAQFSRGLRASYIDSLTADIMLEKAGDVTMSLFGANAPHLEDFFIIETLPAYNNLVEVVETLPGLQAWTSRVSTGARLTLLGKNRKVFLAGIEAESYFPMFPGILLEKGRLLRPGESGVMITRAFAEAFEKSAGEPVEIGAPVTLTAAGRVGFRIRELPLVGIFSFANTNAEINNMVIADAQTARALSEIRTASADVPLSAQTAALLDDDAFDALLHDGADDYTAAAPPLDGRIADFLETATEETQSVSGGDWNFILIKLKPGAPVKKAIAYLNGELRQYGVIAVDWRTAAGVTALYALLLQACYNAGIAIVCVAGVIAMVNILLIAVFKRTREIGTLRAMGAGDGYIRRLLICENCALGVAGGAAGIALGVAALAGINALHITIRNDLIIDLLRLEQLRLTFFPEYAAASALFSVALTFFALIYPIETAVRIEPVIAVREG